MKKYAIYEDRMVSATQIMRAYGLSIAECILVSLNNPASLRGYNEDSLIHLRLRPEGDYMEHLKKLQEKEKN